MMGEPEAVRTLPGELGEYASQIEWQKVEATSLVEVLTDEEFNHRPTDGGWSIGEHLAHLAITTREYLAAINAAVATARAQGALGELERVSTAPVDDA